MSEQPEALRLADDLESTTRGYPPVMMAAAELRRLHAVNQELLGALKDASLYIQDNYLPDKSGHEWDDVIAKAEGK
jgi:hypothetical protein